MTADWNTSTVGEQFHVQLGKMLDAAKNVGVLKPYLGNRAVQWGRIDVSAAGVVPMTRSDIQRYRLREGDLIVCEGGEVGRAAIWRNELSECYYQKALHRLRAKSGYDVRLMLALLTHWSATGAFADFVTQTSIAHLPREKFVLMPLPLPSGPEQRRIAGALADANDLIATLERLIVKKQAVKQGLMQQLLTGRTRLPGFTAEWSKIRLGDHVRYMKIVALSRAQLDANSKLKYLHYGDIHTRSSVLLDAVWEEMPRASEEIAARAEWLQRGDLVFADASEDPAGVGKSVEIVNTPRTGLVPGLHTIAARFDKAVLADGFKAYLQFIPTFRNQLLRLAAGTKVLATTRSYISNVTLTLPDIVEQTAIAEVLLDAELVIETLRVRLTKAHEIKTGMMQQLLTGRTRLPAEIAT